MFDARSILDILFGGPGARPGQGRSMDPSVFRDMLDQLGSQDSPPTPGRPPTQGAPGGRWTEQRYPQAPTGQAPSGPGGGQAGAMTLEDLLRGIFTGTLPQAGPQQGPQQGPAGGQQGPAGGGRAGPGAQQGPAIGPEVGRELQDLLRQILQGGGGGGGGARVPVNRITGEGGPGGSAGAQGGGQGLAEALKQVLGQATAGVREGAGRIDETTGLSDRAREAVVQATGRSPEDLVAQLKELVARNQLAAGATLGGLGALVLGTGAGRSLAATALRLGGLALIGGLAYKAYQNHQQGKPALAAKAADRQALLPAPEGSGFEAGAMSDDAARRCIRAMIAAAAADGRIDADEQQRILGGLRQSGLEDGARQFLAAEINSPANVAELATRVASPEEAIQVYTAARMTVDLDTGPDTGPDTGAEHAFLSSLADALGIDDALAAQVDAATRAAA